jgi:hypothetical protein
MSFLSTKGKEDELVMLIETKVDLSHYVRVASHYSGSRLHGVLSSAPRSRVHGASSHKKNSFRSPAPVTSVHSYL